jgi:pyruvate dehydrogenase E1 component beta subunit
MQMNMVQAVNSALGIALERDRNVLLLGEDIGKSGGVFRVTAGLQQRYGPERVVDTPLAEQAIVGCSVGLAALGLKPVPEIQFEGFSYVTLDQLINHAARLRLRTRGRLSCPLVMRVPVGGGIRALEHHSDSPEALYAQIPGLKVTIPSSPKDAKGLLLACLSENNKDPTVFMEPKRLYRAFKEEVPDGEYETELGRARVLREGTDLSIVSYGPMIPRVAEVAEKVKEKYSVEVVDLRSLSPLDEDAVLNSVKKTGRLLVVHEAPRTLGLGAELSALVAESALEYLEAPIVRVTGWDVPMPLARSEDYEIPSVERILEGIERVMSYVA